MAAHCPRLTKSESLFPISSRNPIASFRPMLVVGLVAAASAIGVSVGAIGAYALARPDSEQGRILVPQVTTEIGSAAIAGPSPSEEAKAEQALAEPSSKKAETRPCAEQTWPYIDSACLKAGGQDARSVRVLPFDAPRQSEVHTIATVAASIAPLQESSKVSSDEIRPAVAALNQAAKPAAVPVKKRPKAAKVTRSRENVRTADVSRDQRRVRDGRYDRRDTVDRRGYASAYSYAPEYDERRGFLGLW